MRALNGQLPSEDEVKRAAEAWQIRQERDHNAWMQGSFLIGE